MIEFVKARAIVVDLLEESRLRRHADEVFAPHIERLGATDTEVCAGRLDQALGIRNDLGFRKRRRAPVSLVRHSLALLDVEQGEALYA